MYKQSLKEINRSIALKYLDKNTMNRYLNQKTIDRYAAQMQKGEWKVNGESLKFAEDGTLLDGQHRLHAVVKANAKVTMPIFEGVTKDAIMTMDTGKPRTLADHLMIHGFKPVNKVDLKTIAAAIRILYDFESGCYRQRKIKITPTDAIAYLQANSALFDSASLISEFRKQINIPPSILVSLHYLYSKKHKEEADYFFQSLSTGANLAETSPILALRNKLMYMDGASKVRSVTKRRVYISYLTQAMKCHLKNLEMTSHEMLRYEHQKEICLYD